MKTLNLTQHAATADQLEAGVVDVPAERITELKKLLDVPELPTQADLQSRVTAIVAMADAVANDEIPAVMIGGAPFLMALLDRDLSWAGFKVKFAFSKRVSVETTMPDGSVRKTADFKHIGMVDSPIDWRY
jgi:hypothetical protein